MERRLGAGNASGIFALYNTNYFFGQFKADFFRNLTVLNNVDGNVGVNVAQHIIVQVDDLVDLQDVLFSVLAAGGILDDGHFAVHAVQAQLFIQVQTLTSRDVVDDELIQMIESHLSRKKVKGYKIESYDIQLVGRPTRKK